MSVLDLTQWPSVIGKDKLLVKVLKAGHTLFRKQLHSRQNVMENTSPPTMTAGRRRMWKGKIGSANNYCFCAKASVPPPTGESFLFNAKPSHFQACIWRHARESRPPLLDQLEHGWIWDTVNTILTPVMWPGGCHLHLTTYR